MDAQVELLARLHLAGFFWGDCSLSNTLFRFDAGALSAYLVDAETAEIHPQLSDGQREYDAATSPTSRSPPSCIDLQAGELLAEDIDAIEVADDLVRRYRRLWARAHRRGGHAAATSSGTGSASASAGSTSSASTSTRSS